MRHALDDAVVDVPPSGSRASPRPAVAPRSTPGPGLDRWLARCASRERARYSLRIEARPSARRDGLELGPSSSPVVPALPPEPPVSTELRDLTASETRASPFTPAPLSSRPVAPSRVEIEIGASPAHSPILNLCVSRRDRVFVFDVRGRPTDASSVQALERRLRGRLAARGQILGRLWWSR